MDALPPPRDDVRRLQIYDLIILFAVLVLIAVIVWGALTLRASLYCVP